MADKGFNIVNDCPTCFMYFIVPHKRRSVTQVTPANVNKTYSIVKVRILMEQEI